MTLERTIRGSLLGLLAVLAALAAGCGQAEQGPKKEGPKAASKDAKHEGWWCKEHGIPEEECSMCSARAAKECKARRDWCKKHDRALTQCFICNPKRKEFYAAKYRAKYGKEPPPVEDDLADDKEGDKKSP